MKTLLLIAILFATTITVAGVQLFTPSFIAGASAQDEEVVEVEEGEVEEAEVEEADEEEEQPDEESEYEPAYNNGY